MGITISNFQGLWLGFFLWSTLQHLWVMGVYIVWVKTVCIKYDSSVKQNVSRVFHGNALPARHSQKPAIFILFCSSKFAWHLIKWLCMFIYIPTWRVWGNWTIKEDMESWTSRELLWLITPLLNKFVIPR